MRHLRYRLKFWFNALLDFVFPAHCAMCGEQGAWLCATCEQNLSTSGTWPCLFCRDPVVEGTICPACQHESALAQLHVMSSLNPVLRRCVHLYKYQFTTVLTPYLRAALSEYLMHLQAIIPLYPILIPVPLHGQRERWRGFNQSRELAEALLQVVPDARLNTRLLRQRHTHAQMSLDREHRMHNLSGAFLYDGPPLYDEDIILIDDITTTGATLMACAEALQLEYPRSVSGLVLGHGGGEESITPLVVD